MMNEIQGETPSVEVPNEFLALLVLIFCSKEIQGEEEEG